MFSTFPYKAIKYQFSSDLPLITLTGIGFQNITDHSYSWHNLHRHDKHCLIQYCISGQGVLTINNSTYTITSGKAFLLNIPSNSHYYLPQNSTHWKFIYLEFSPEVLPHIMQTIWNGRIVFIFCPHETSPSNSNLSISFYLLIIPYNSIRNTKILQTIPPQNRYNFKPSYLKKLFLLSSSSRIFCFITLVSVSDCFSRSFVALCIASIFACNAFLTSWTVFS